MNASNKQQAEKEMLNNSSHKPENLLNQWLDVARENHKKMSTDEDFRQQTALKATADYHAVQNILAHEMACQEALPEKE